MIFPHTDFQSDYLWNLQSLWIYQIDETDETDNLDELTANITAREEREQAVAAAVDSGDLQAVVDATGQSERTARRKTKGVRDQQKADRDAAVISLHQQGKTPTEIATSTGTPRGTVHRILKTLDSSAQNGQPLYNNYIERVRNGHSPENVDVTCLKNTEPVTVNVHPTAEGFTDSLRTYLQPYTVHFTTDAGETVPVRVYHKPPPQHVPNIEQATERSIEDDILDMYHAGKSARDIATELFLPIDDITGIIDAQHF